LKIRFGSLEKKREEVSKMWAENPPPGAYDWDDDTWLLKIDEYILGEDCANYINKQNKYTEDIEEEEST